LVTSVTLHVQVVGYRNYTYHHNVNTIFEVLSGCSLINNYVLDVLVQPNLYSSVYEQTNGNSTAPYTYSSQLCCQPTAMAC